MVGRASAALVRARGLDLIPPFIRDPDDVAETERGRKRRCRLSSRSACRDQQNPEERDQRRAKAFHVGHQILCDGPDRPAAGPIPLQVSASPYARASLPEHAPLLPRL